MHPEMTAGNERGSSGAHVLFATWLGELFDGMDASIYVLVLFPALSELLKTTDHSQVGVVGSYVLAIFMVGWAVGAMVFGCLADYIGRAKTMMITILLYAICTGLCAISQTWQELAFYRFLVGCGIGGEISIGAVMLSEFFKGRSRLHAVAFLSTSFGCGYLIAAVLNLLLGGLGWRWLFLAGVAPALVTVYIRAKIKEPEQFIKVQQIKKVSSGKGRSHFGDVAGFTFLKLFNPENRGKVLVVIGLASTAIIGYWAVLSWIPAWVNQLTGTNAIAERSQTAITMNIGAILAAAFGGVLIERLGRANAFRFAFAGGLISCVSMFLSVKAFGPMLLGWVFFVG
ncbi:MAG TPA: MFS transporter, partial [Candidatus Obscuribacterales bacterium]